MHLLKRIIRNVVSITQMRINQNNKRMILRLQAEGITNANGSNANETQVQAALNQLNQAKTT